MDLRRFVGVPHRFLRFRFALACCLLAPALGWAEAGEAPPSGWRELQEQAEDGPLPSPATPATRQQQVRIAAEAGLAFFHTGADGPFPEGSMRVDDPVISVEAPV